MPTTDTAARTAISRVARCWLSNCPPYSTKYPSGSGTFSPTAALDVGDHRRQVAAEGVAPDDDPPAGVLPLHLVGPGVARRSAG